MGSHVPRLLCLCGKPRYEARNGPIHWSCVRVRWNQSIVVNVKGSHLFIMVTPLSPNCTVSAQSTRLKQLSAYMQWPEHGPKVTDVGWTHCTFSTPGLCRKVSAGKSCRRTSSMKSHDFSSASPLEVWSRLQVRNLCATVIPVYGSSMHLSNITAYVQISLYSRLNSGLWNLVHETYSPSWIAN